MSSEANLVSFIRESNMIEGIHREPSGAELGAYEKFLSWKEITVGRLEDFVMEIAGAELRRKHGMDVSVGNHFPAPGGHDIEIQLTEFLRKVMCIGKSLFLSPYQAHLDYETLHPFTDGNGRSGRAIWLRMMNGNAPLGFLHTFYYQTLANQRD